MPRARIAAVVCVMPLLLSACMISNEPSTPRAKQHFDAISYMSTTAAKYGFQEGAIKKTCEIALDCKPNDLYQYFSTELKNADGKLTDVAVCTSIFNIAQEVGFDFWRNQERDPSLEVVDLTSPLKGIDSCAESLDVIIHGKVNSYEPPVVYQMQIALDVNEKGFHTYTLMIGTSEDPWPIPQPSTHS